MLDLLQTDLMLDLAKRPADARRAVRQGLEHFVLMEILAHRSYRELDYPVHFWRTRDGLDVDFVLGEAEAAVEVKGWAPSSECAMAPSPEE